MFFYKFRLLILLRMLHLWNPDIFRGCRGPPHMGEGGCMAMEDALVLADWPPQGGQRRVRIRGVRPKTKASS
jgi:hypothetical protein